MAYKRAAFLDKLRQYHPESGFSYDDLAERAGVSRKTIANWLNVGLSRRPEQNKVLHIAAALNLSKAKTMELLALADYPYPVRKELENLADKESNPQVKEVLWQWLTETLSQIFQAPLALDYFVGRAEEAKKLSVQFGKLGTPNLIIGLSGMGGVGKTSLATYLAHKFEQENRFPDGILWARFTPDTTPEVVLQKFLLTFGAGGEAPDLRQKANLLQQVLANKKVLVVLDNVEKSEQVEWIIPKDSQTVMVLITTRNQEVFEALREKGYRVEVHALKRFSHEEGLTLFAHRIKARALAEEQALRETINLVGGLPLALSIAAGHLAKQPNESVASYNQRLQDKALERLFDSRDPLERNVLASFELSYGDLPPLWRKLFVALSIFEGPDFSLKTIEAVMAEAGPVISEMDLADLCARSLVEAGPAEGRPLPPGQNRYHLHPLLKDFAKIKLAQEQAFKEIFGVIQHRAADHFVDFVQQNNHKDGYRDLDFEWGNIFGVLKWAYQQQAWSTLVAGVQELTRPNLGMIGFVDAWGYWGQAREFLGWAVEGEPAPDLAKAALLTKLGAFAFKQADLTGAKAYLEQGQAILDNLPLSEEVIIQRTCLYEFRSRLALQTTTLPEALAWLKQGLTELENVGTNQARAEKGYLSIQVAGLLGRMGEFQAATEAAQQGLALLPATPTSAGISGLITLGNLALLSGDMDTAKQHFWEGLKIAEELGDARRQAILWLNLGTVAALRGALPESNEHYGKALETYKKMGSADQQGSVLSNLGLNYIKLGEDQAALTHLTQAIKLAETHHLPRLEAFAKTNLANLQIYQNQLPQAEATLSRAEAICRHHQGLPELPEILYLQAEIALRQDQPERALKLTEESLQEAQATEDELRQGIAWRIKGDIFSLKQHFAEALAAYQTSLETLTDQDPYELAKTQLALARYYLISRQQAPAKSLLAEALATFEALQAKREMGLTQALLAQ